MSGELLTDTYEEGSTGVTGGFLLNFTCSNGTHSRSARKTELGLGLCNSDTKVAGHGGGDGSAAALRITISLIYSVVCALGLIGNVLVLYLMKSKKHAWTKSSSPIDLFVTGLALTDVQFVLTLPFWAVENALDFTWVFGRAMCKIVSYVTASNMYASVFFLTAMSVARYCSLTSALRSRGRRARGRRTRVCRSAACVSAAIWCAAACAALPHAVFSTAATVSGEQLCLVKFPPDARGDAQFWLALYHAQKVLLGFVAPLGIITACYLLLLRVVHADRGVRKPGAGRRFRVTRSVTIIVLCFFLCWLPNQALTAWGILIKLNVVDFSDAYYTTQAYLFPVSVCLAHSNSCLNPILYCLMRREFRKLLSKLLWRITWRPVTHMGPLLITAAARKPNAAEEDEHQRRVLLVPVSSPGEPVVVCYPVPPGVVVYDGNEDLLPNNT